MDTPIKVDAREILFIKENAPKGFASLIVDSLKSEGIYVSRVMVHREISTLKNEYHKSIIQAARRLLKAIKGIEFNPSSHA